MTAKQKAEELVNWFTEVKPPKLSDYSKIYSPTARLCALKVVEEVLGHMGADRGYQFWTDVKNELYES